jgi:hypothetical protein
VRMTSKGRAGDPTGFCELSASDPERTLSILNAKKVRV